MPSHNDKDGARPISPRTKIPRDEEKRGSVVRDSTRLSDGESSEEESNYRGEVEEEGDEGDSQVCLVRVPSFLYAPELLGAFFLSIYPHHPILPVCLQAAIAV